MAAKHRTNEEGRSNSIYRRWGKRATDLVILLLLAPIILMVFAVVGLLVRMRLGAPVMFRQRRIGYNDLPFTLVKFRTMLDARDASGALLPDERRLTPFGSFLRASSLDEIPTLWNVLRGEMSLVGPRPLLTGYLPLYSPFQRRRHEVKPGVTGWAQVNGRNAISWGMKFRHDVWYVDNLSFRLDVRICLLTVLKVLARQDIAHPGVDTMPPFTGEVEEGAGNDQATR
jgi:sugar transferase EpsL